MFYLLLASYVLSTAGGLILIKLGSVHRSLIEVVSGRPVLNVTLLSFIGVCLYGISFILYTYLIAKNELGFIIPLTTALVYILIFIASATIFKEAFTVTKILGIVLIVAGLIILNIKK